MPDGVADGMLESLCRFAVNEAPSAHCVDTLFQCVGTQSISPKAWTHAFIAIQADPDLHFGKAATKGYWNLQHAVFDDIMKFIVNLDTTA